MCRLALVFGIAACFGIVATERGPSNAIGALPYGARRICAGCPVPYKPDAKLLKELKAGLALRGVNVKPAQITKATSQIVSGVKFRVKFVTEDNKKCSASWIDRPWISPEPLYFLYKCA